MTDPARTPAWMEAPMATASSGLTPFEGSRPKTPLTVSTTLGIRDIPPTRMTSLMSAALRERERRDFVRTRARREEGRKKRFDSLDSSVGKSLLARVDGLGDQRSNEGLELGSGELDVDVLGSRSVGGDVGKVDLCEKRTKEGEFVNFELDFSFDFENEM